MTSTRYSFTSADSLPAKLISDSQIVEKIAEEHIIYPTHAQVIPTNKCNLKCKFCSCANEDRNLEMTRDQISTLPERLFRNGTEAVTITGGGEPLCHPHINELMLGFDDLHISTGLVTNGRLLDALEVSPMWCRISVSDTTGPNLKAVERAMDRLYGVDWAFSYVLSDKPNLAKLKKYCSLTLSDPRFTHIRVVSDLLNPTDVPEVDLPDDPKIIMQGRKEPRAGTACWMHWLKPVIGPDLRVYTCCGAQYALEPPSLKMPDELCVGTLDEYLARNVRNKPFDGTICKRCYYTSYNSAIGAMLSEKQHKEFV